jgi:hypothetical protein
VCVGLADGDDGGVGTGCDGVCVRGAAGTGADYEDAGGSGKGLVRGWCEEGFGGGGGGCVFGHFEWYKGGVG